MLYRDRCVFCKQQVNDNEQLMQNYATNEIAHLRCLDPNYEQARQLTLDLEFKDKDAKVVAPRPERSHA